MQYDGLTTVKEPPCTVTFDPENRKSSLVSRNRAASSVSATSGGLSPEMSTLSAVSNLISSVASFMRPDHATPTTPKALNPSASIQVVPDSPPVIYNTPSKLERFLEAAEGNGIPKVQCFYLSLSLKGYGPDILHLISVQDLVEIGMSPGDAIRLRDYALRWWTEERQRVAKRPRVVDDTSTDSHATLTTAPPATDITPPNKRFRFEKRFNDGGGMTTYGPGIIEDKGNYQSNDYTWWVYSRDLKMDVPLPVGKVPIIADDEPTEDEYGNFI